jgi:YD repeat-containing protein
MPDSVIHYKYQNGQFVWVKKKNMDYNTYTQPYKIFQGRASLRGNSILVSESSMSQDELTENFGNLEYKYNAIEVGAMQLTHEDEIQKDDNGNTLTTSTNYYYTNPDPSVVTRIESTGSDGLTTVQHITFPTDYAAGGFITPLITNNIVSVPVEKVIRKNGKIISGQVLTYNANGTLATSYQVEANPPVSQSSFKMSNRSAAGDFSSSSPNVAFNPDAGYTQKLSLDWDNSYLNLKQVLPAAGTPASYIWDYNNVYPIAQVNNANVGNIAYTSFESDGKGNWSFSGATTTDATSPTGRKAYDISNPVSKSALTSTDVYILSYWRNAGSGPLSVTGSISTNGYPRTGPTLNGWTYYEHKITGTTSTSISGAGLIDELRLYPATAQMTTYTYDPLIGMTSQCDASNRIIYYEYDSFGRLKTIRDQDRNVIKTIDYQYQKNYNQ